MPLTAYMFTCRFANTLRLLTRTFSDAAIRKKGEFELKYAHKLSQRLKEEGVSSIAEFHKKTHKETDNNAKRGENAVEATLPRSNKATSLTDTTFASPIKPLGQILDLNKITTTAHSPEQVANIWNGYHSTVGRGYLSATIPASIFSSLIETAKQFPRFIIPLERTTPDNQKTGHEFFFLEWTFHRSDESSEQAAVMFTPLQEYKLRQEFSQPYFVMACYSNLMQTHQIGLMRGEITSSPNRPGDFLLSQNEAHILAVELQKFYLAKDGEAGRKILETFHRNKAEFQWEALLQA